MASYIPVVKNGANGAIFYVSLAPRTATGAWQANPTLATGDVKLSKDGGALADLTTLPAVTPAASKLVKVTLSQTETNADNLTVIFSDAAGAEWNDLTINLQTAALQFDTLASPTNITAGTITTATNVTTVNGLAANVITAASIATDAIGAAELAADAVTEIRSLASGTSDSGSTTTMVDAARTEADNDYWTGQIIVFTSGTIAGQARLITSFVAATDTITFAPATTQTVGTQTYEIWPQGRVDVHMFAGTAATVAAGRPEVNTTHIAGSAVSTSTAQLGVNVVNFGGSAGTFASGRPETNTTHIAGSAVSTSSAQIGVNVVNAGATAWNSGAIKTTTFTAGAIDAAAIATDAIGAAELADGAITAATFAAGAIDATAIADNAIDAGAIATGAITSAKFASGAIDAAAIAANAIGSSELADGAITAAKFAAGAIDATAIANNAIDAATFAADVDAEILSYIVDDATRIDASALNTATVTTVPAIKVDTAAILVDTGTTLDTAITSILADTNELQTDWANGGRLDNILDARASQTSVDDLPTNAELTTALGTADDAVLTAIGDLPTAAENATELLDQANGVEAGLTVRGALRLTGAALGGKVSGAGTATETFRNAVADSKDRIAATVDEDGNRTAITTDLT